MFWKWEVPLCLYLGKSLCCSSVHPLAAVSACPFCPLAFPGLAAVHFETKCLSCGPALVCLWKTQQASPQGLQGPFGGLGHPALAKLWGEEVLKEATLDPVRRRELLWITSSS